jgi:hypothetical protein
VYYILLPCNTSILCVVTLRRRNYNLYHLPFFISGVTESMSSISSLKFIASRHSGGNYVGAGDRYKEEKRPRRAMDNERTLRWHLLYYFDVYTSFCIYLYGGRRGRDSLTPLIDAPFLWIPSRLDFSLVLATRTLVASTRAAPLGKYYDYELAITKTLPRPWLMVRYSRYVST